MDRDYAAFAQMTWDMGAGWSLTGGFRQYRYDNSLQGFYGYALGYTGPGSIPGQATCGPPGKGGSLARSIRIMRRSISHPARI